MSHPPQRNRVKAAEAALAVAEAKRDAYRKAIVRAVWGLENDESAAVIADYLRYRLEELA